FGLLQGKNNNRMVTKNKKSSSISRRKFFRSASVAIGSVIALMMGIPLVDSIVSNTKVFAAKAFSKLGPINNIPDSFSPVLQPTKLNFSKTDQDAFVRITKPEQVWVVKKSDSATKVFSPICPHLGCRYNWDEEKKQFVCPCHNSVFTIDGKLVSGPAPRGLDELPAEVKDGNLYVQYEKFEVGIPKKIIID
ncbi:MAG TPA: ubiquinol-cytochrome c reductase iron-sulfur subunit, partial [Sunxiuqinia sp.]|nr:ubiquinol-cytochrome c reductase iron-sulfur subunit [Sunxiuqinia sp.]